MIRLISHKVSHPAANVDLDFLLGLAEDVSARVVYRDLHVRHPQLEAYTRGKQIYLDKSLERRPRAHRCILSEEIGHVLYPPTGGHASYHIADAWNEMDYWTRDNLAVLVAKDERWALKFATGLLVPDEAFWRFAASGPREIWEWCEEFDVEKWFLEVKIGLIRVGQLAGGRLRRRQVAMRK